LGYSFGLWCFQRRSVARYGTLCFIRNDTYGEQEKYSENNKDKGESFSFAKMQFSLYLKKDNRASKKKSAAEDKQGGNQEDMKEDCLVLRGQCSPVVKIEEVADNDVMCGHGGRVNQNPGNTWLTLTGVASY